MRRSFLLLLAACGGSDEVEEAPDAFLPDTTVCEEAILPGGTPTWNEDVGALVTARCGSCHQAGGIAPVTLATYEDAAPWASVIATVVEDGSMPPWPPSACGDCPETVGSLALTPGERGMLLAWADGGAPEGPPGEDLPEPPALPGLARVDRTLDPGAAYTPSTAKSDDYRCFIVDASTTGTQYMTGFHFRPDVVEEVHHAILFALDDDGAVSQAQALDAGEGGPGWTCYGGPGVNGRFVAGWAPGSGAKTYPPGTGIPLGERPMVLQVHYNLANGASPDRSVMELMLEDTVAKPATIDELAQTSLHLDPGEPELVRTITRDVPGSGPVALLHGAVGHMHELGSRVSITVERGEESFCVLNIPQWDFNWQGFWFFEEPVVLEGGDVVRLTCTYDTTSRDTRTEWGDGTSDEMCIAYAYVTGP